MYDCFISYSSADTPLAYAIKDRLESHEINVFMAVASLRPGEKWSSAILDALRQSRWVLFVATKASCTSAYVMQELGGAVYADKELISIVSGISPTDLPGWAKEYHALDLRSMTEAEMETSIADLAEQMRAAKQERTNARFVLGALAVGVFAAARSQ